jgi:hypothetical protein
VFVQAFLVNMLTLYPLLGVNAFQETPVHDANNADGALNREILTFPLEGVDRARGRVSANGFTLLAGSTLRRHRTDTFSPAASRRSGVGFRRRCCGHRTCPDPSLRGRPC